jgi:hypothetical protein
MGKITALLFDFGFVFGESVDDCGGSRDLTALPLVTLQFFLARQAELGCGANEEPLKVDIGTTFLALAVVQATDCSHSLSNSAQLGRDSVQLFGHEVLGDCPRSDIGLVCEALASDGGLIIKANSHRKKLVTLLLQRLTDLTFVFRAQRHYNQLSTWKYPRQITTGRPPVARGPKKLTPI